MPIRSPIAPAQVSRTLLLALVAGGALLSIATAGVVSHFAGGFAVGAGAALIASRVALGREETGSCPEKDAP
jgi:hypothetical protein